MDKDLLKGIKIALGFFFTLSVLFGLVFAVGFHSANEIGGGVFQGNYTITGNLNVSGETNLNGNITGTLPPGLKILSNSSSCPNGLTLERGSVLVSQGTGISQSDATYNSGTAFDGVVGTRTPNSGGNTEQDNANTNLNVGKYYSGGKTLSGYVAYSSTDEGWYEGSAVATSKNLNFYGSNVSFKDGSATLLNSVNVTDSQSALSVDNQEIGSWNYEYFWLQLEASGSGGIKGAISEIYFYELSDTYCIS